MMHQDMIENYIEKVYGYAIKHTFSREEADELAQEILFTAVRELPRLKEEGKFEPWLWGIANNVTKSFRRNLGKWRAMYSYDTLENLSYEETYFDPQEEIYNSLRTKIAMLSEAYRDIIILYYYDDLSTKSISKRLNIPEGTVRWRLTEARRKLKKECEFMEITALKPKKLEIRISGEGDYDGITKPFPHVYISDALSQNILYYCYEEPKTVEELAKLCGVPAYYVEESLENLIRREALSEIVKGKYRTEFIIYSDKVSEYRIKTKGIFENIVKPFVGAMKQLADLVDDLEIYTAEKPKEELVYLYGLMALEHLSDKYNSSKNAEYKVRYDGNRWNYHAHLITDAKYPVRGLGRETGRNLGSRGTYSHCSYHFGGFAYRYMMYDNQINVCEDILEGREIQDLDSAASAIEAGYILKRNKALFVTVPAFTKTQYEQFKVLAEKVFDGVIEEYEKAVEKYIAGYKKLFPAHLEEQVAIACNYMFLTLYATDVCDLAKEKGLLVPPSATSICDVMIQYK